ncbi:unnamed protein product, partial [Amoebophrya sp. A25]|eukprot:GSA25T00022434001.1
MARMVHELRRLPFFEACRLEFVYRLSARIVRKRFPAGEIIFREGDTNGNSMCIVYRGSVQIEVSTQARAAATSIIRTTSSISNDHGTTAGSDRDIRTLSSSITGRGSDVVGLFSDVSTGAATSGGATTTSSSTNAADNDASNPTSSNNVEVVKKLLEGEIVGELAVLGISRKRTATVRACATSQLNDASDLENKSGCELLVVLRDDLWDLLTAKFPDEYDSFQLMGEINFENLIRSTPFHLNQAIPGFQRHISDALQPRSTNKVRGPVSSSPRSRSGGAGFGSSTTGALLAVEPTLSGRPTGSTNASSLATM